MADDKKPDDKKPEDRDARGPQAPAAVDAKADKAYEQRRAGLLPPDSMADRLVLAARKVKADAQAAARRVREEAVRARRSGAVEAP